MHTHFDTAEETEDSGTKPSLTSFLSPLVRPYMTDANSKIVLGFFFFPTPSNILSDERTTQK